MCFAYCGLFSTAVPEKSPTGKLLAAHLIARLRVVASFSTYLQTASAVRSRSIKGTLLLDIGLAKFIFALNHPRVMPPRSNALAPRGGSLRTLRDPTQLAGPACVADVPALNSSP